MSHPVTLFPRGIAALVLAVSAAAHAQPAPDAVAANDVFGVRKIYPDLPGGERWSMNMTDANADPRFDPQATLARNADGSWRFASDSENHQVRMSALTSAGYASAGIVSDHAVLAQRGYMYKPRDWKNVEITGYVRVIEVEDASDEVTWYARGGHHSNPQPFCEGVAYKGDLKFDGRVRTAKEQWHVNYDFRPGNGVTATSNIIGRWVGFKTIMYNIDAGAHVRVELWVDAQADNTWTLAYHTIDAGGWGTKAGTCHAAVPDQVITWGGPLAVFRWDNVRRISFKNLSVREIDATGDGLFADGFDMP